MCECLTTTQETIKKFCDDPDASIDTGFCLDGNILNVYPVFTASYRRKKKSGEYMAKKSSLPLIPVFCPFCGKKYKESSTNEQS